MSLPDKPTSFADLLAGEGAEDEQIRILKKRLLIPLVVFAVLLVAWVAWRHLPGGLRIAQAPHAASDSSDPAVSVGNLTALN